MELMAIVLSPMGYEKVNQIRLADDDFKVNGSQRRPRGGSPGGNGGVPMRSNVPAPPPGPGGPGAPGGRPGPRGGLLFGKDLYYISFLGTPSTTVPWMLQFGGHHLALNITIAGNRGVLDADAYRCSTSNIYRSKGETVRPLGRESDKALALLQYLDEKQREQAAPQLPRGGSGTWAWSGRQENCSRGAKGLDNEREAAGDAGEPGFRSGPALSTKVRPPARARMAELRADLSETWFA